MLSLLLQAAAAADVGGSNSSAPIPSTGLLPALKALDASGELAMHYVPTFLFCLGVVLVPVFYILPSPYGRYKEDFAKYIPDLVHTPVRLAWFLMEGPALLFALFNIWSADQSVMLRPPNVILIGLFTAHYINRTLIYPFRLNSNKPFGLTVLVIGMLFNSSNGYMQGRAFTRHLSFDDGYETSAQFIVGVATCLCGAYINIRSDGIMLNLRKPGETGYKIPRGGLYEYVSGANFFGEIVEWTGFVIASDFSFTSISFLSVIVGNLVPRAIMHHNYYKAKFREEYPSERKILVPFVF